MSRCILVQITLLIFLQQTFLQYLQEVTQFYIKWPVGSALSEFQCTHHICFQNNLYSSDYLFTSTETVQINALKPMLQHTLILTLHEDMRSQHILE
jgi:hypothetical protein